MTVAPGSFEDDQWPSPDFNPGERKHLHAIGVIAVKFAQFQRGTEDLFLYHPANALLPVILLTEYFYTLNEEQRVKVTREFFARSEPDATVAAAANNALDLYNWASDCRNKVLHSELYPPGLAGKRDTLYLTKRASKRDHSTRYMALDLRTLRSTAEHMQKGVLRLAEIRLYTRYRRRDPSDPIPEELRYIIDDPDFSPIVIPPPIALTEVP